MKEWSNLILWFQLLKKGIGVEIRDNFEVRSDKVCIDGGELNQYMTGFWEREGLSTGHDTLCRFDVCDIDKRMRLKSHLVQFLNSQKKM